MKKLYFRFIYVFVFLSVILAFNVTSVLASADTTKRAKQSTKINDTRLNKPEFLKSGIKIKFTPFKPFATKSSNTVAETKNETKANDEKILSNVKVYPNPVEAEVNISYRVNKESNVIIKIMDVLGNEISTLLSQKLSVGEQVNTFNIASRLNSGFYFIRLTVGNETVVKRISVL